MKNLFKLAWITALAAVIGFSMAACGGPNSATAADPEVNWPSGLTAAVGQTLGDVALPANNGSGTPGVFSWTEDAATPVGDAGDQIHSVTFTPTDTSAYNILTHDVTISVSDVPKIDPTVNWPSGLSATAGDTLANITLPDNGAGTPGAFSWTEDAATSAGDVGDQAHNVTFTPTDTAAYNILTHDVTVTVAYGSTGLQPDGSFVLFDGTSWAGGDITIQYEGSDNDEVVYFKAPIDISGYKHAILEYQDQWWWGWNGGHFIVNSGTKYTYWNTEYYVPDNIKEAEFYNLTLNFSDANSYTGPVDSDGAVPAGTELKGFCWQRDGSYNAAILQKITLIKDIPDVGDGTGIQPDGSLVLFNNGAWAAACGDVTEEQQASDMVKIFSTPIDVGGYKQAILELYDSPWFWGNLIGQFMIDGGGAYSYWGNGWNDDTNSVIPDYSYTENPLILTLSFSEATGGGAVDAGGAILAGIKFSEFSWKRNADYNTDIISKITLTK